MNKECRTMRWQEGIRMIKFLLFSISAGIVEMAVFAILHYLTSLKYRPNYLIALAISVIWNFTLNREFTFKSANNIPVAMLKVLAFYCVFTPFSTWLGGILADEWMWNPFLVTAINMVLNFVTEYLYDRYFVFGATLDTKKKNAEHKAKRQV